MITSLFVIGQIIKQTADEWTQTFTSVLLYNFFTRRATARRITHCSKSSALILQKTSRLVRSILLILIPKILMSSVDYLNDITGCTKISVTGPPSLLDAKVQGKLII